MFLRLAYADLLYVLIPIFLLFFIYRIKFFKSPRYVYPLTESLAQHHLTQKIYHKKIFFVLRLLALLGLALLVCRPQWVDEKSNININGVNIVLAIDVSGSMQLFDDPKDRRMRIEVAKAEAIRFIEKRHDDPIGIVIFGKDALSRCPLTLDKLILKQIVGSLELGIIDPSGTWLGTGLATAINRLRHSKAKSKVLVLLTDGEPTPPEKIDPDTAITMAQQFGIKVYTIGVGNEQGGYIEHPLWGVQQVQERLNVPLLEKIAQKTGGKFFRANKPADMRTIYDTINTLEKTEYQTNLFAHYYEAFLTFIWLIFVLLGVELLLRIFIWPGI